MTSEPNIAIIIPARYASTRLPGKPLLKIAGKTMLQRVVQLARYASREFENIRICVATENIQIRDHAKELDVECMLTDPQCPSGSDRALAAVEQFKERPDVVINLQGDAPFTEPLAVKRIIQSFIDNPDNEVVTPITQLSWGDLDRLRDNKMATPFSGTTAITDNDGRAIWFSKNIIPAIRDEIAMRESGEPYSPVFRHIGLYGYRLDILETFQKTKPSRYETLEGLEQLRLLENGVKIQTVEIELAPGAMQSGIDTAEDIDRAERMIANYGDPMTHQNTL